MSMHAAVVRSFDHPPRYETYDTPEPAGPDELLVDVLAVGLHPRVRTGASGRHYTSTGTLPMIPGIDGVGRLPDGRRIYFVAPTTPGAPWPTGPSSTCAGRSRCPRTSMSTKVAAAMNPAMSAWVALRRRVPLQPGQSVLVLGATGNAGAMAVQVAKRLGAGRVVGAGRDPERLAGLPALGADEVVALADDAEVTAERLAEAAAEVDIVIDYLWGEPATTAMMALLEARSRPQPSPGLDPDRSHGRPHHRAAVGGAPVGQPPAPGQRAGGGVAPGLPGRASVPDRGDRCRNHRHRGPTGRAGRCRVRLDGP